MRYCLKLAYKGTDFHGWQNQPETITVQGEIEKSLSVLLREPCEIVGCGRTDTGVHASDYYAHFDSDQTLDIDLLRYQLNATLPKTIVIYNILKTHDDFHARFDALSRTYKYYIILGHDPFKLDTTWQIPNTRFDVNTMNQAADILLQHTDFKSFSRSKTDVKHYNCNITEAFWKHDNYELVFTISANRFLRNMVRAIVGTLIEVGTGKISVSDFETIIKSRDRSVAGKSVPAQGLFLNHIIYEWSNKL